MSNGAVVNSPLGSISSRALAYLQQQKQAGTYKDELGGGITTGFAILTYRGKVWRIKHQGAESPLMRMVDGEKEPTPSVNVILVKAADHLSKNWYEKGYVEGSAEPPDCASTNGVQADIGSPKRQGARDANGQNTGNGICAACPHNQFGSRVSQDGNAKGKACADSKRIAVVPDVSNGDFSNEALGGPMLFRVPAASLGDLKKYAGAMDQAGYPYFAVSTKLSFETAQAYPKIQMKGVRALSDAEVDQIIALRDDPRTANILSTVEVAETPTAEAPPEPLFEQPPPAKQAAPTPAPAPAPEPVKQAEAPAPQTIENDNGFGMASEAPPAAVPEPAPQAPAPAPKPAQAAPTPAAAPPQQAAPVEFDSLLDSLMG